MGTYMAVLHIFTLIVLVVDAVNLPGVEPKALVDLYVIAPQHGLRSTLTCGHDRTRFIVVCII